MWSNFPAFHVSQCLEFAKILDQFIWLSIMSWRLSCELRMPMILRWSRATRYWSCYQWTVGLRWSVQMNKPGLVIVIWVVVSNIFYFHPYLGKWSNFTNIFQRGWNHQLVIVDHNFGLGGSTEIHCLLVFGLLESLMSHVRHGVSTVADAWCDWGPSWPVLDWPKIHHSKLVVLLVGWGSLLSFKKHF